MLRCSNLASAVYMTLYDRHCKRVLAGLEPPLSLRDVTVTEEAPEVMA